jgi:hypothetical protein
MSPDFTVGLPRAPHERGWRRFSAALPMRGALVTVGVVWLLGCVWSFQEQSAFAASKGFTFPHLLPLVIDGFAVSMAGVSWAASLDARPAILARLAMVVAVGASSASNGVWAWLRTHHDVVAVALGVTVPVSANMAFEVLLTELRRQVQRRRGLPAPVAVPYPRLVRLALAPWRTFRSWRDLVLHITADHTLVSERSAAAESFVARHPAPGVPPSPTSGAVPEPTASAAAALSPGPPPLQSSRRDPVPVPPRPPEPEHRWPSAADRSVRSAGAGAPPATRRTAGSPAKRSGSPPGVGAPDNAAAVSAADPRVLALAQHLSSTADPDRLTGKDVSAILGITISSRTGRRLLGQARNMLAHSERLGPDPDPGRPEQLFAVVHRHSDRLTTSAPADLTERSTADGHR